MLLDEKNSFIKVVKICKLLLPCDCSKQKGLENQWGMGLKAL